MQWDLLRSFYFFIVVDVVVLLSEVGLGWDALNVNLVKRLRLDGGGRREMGEKMLKFISEYCTKKGQRFSPMH